MNKCEKCGEYVDWNNPNIHYGGHHCNTIVKPVETYNHEKVQKFQKTKLTWQDVFNCYKLYPENYHSIISYLKCTSYNYLAFNGMVYSVEDKERTNPICSEYDL